MNTIRTVPGDTGDPAAYFEALSAVGLQAAFGASLEGVSGLMLMGGTDVNPARYGQRRHPETEAPDDERDKLECALVAEALDRDMPILAICRGMQLLNVQHGGTLIQHLETVERHRLRPVDKGENAHGLDIIPGSLLARLAGSLENRVNSRHHQAVGIPGAGLTVVASDPVDGVIEAVERPDKHFVIGVQWHPENQTALRDGLSAALFRAFGEATRR